MKRLISLSISISIIISVFFSGCDLSSLDFIEKNSTDNDYEIDIQNGSDDGFIFEFDVSEDIDTALASSDGHSTCPLSDAKIKNLIKNAEDTIAQYPEFSGTVLLSSGDKIIFEKSYGKSGVKNGMNRNETIYQIGSVTKQFTGTAILQLAAQGKLKTTDTINKYFPEYSKYDFTKKITVENLLEMTEGLYDYMELIEGDENKLKAYVAAANKSESEAKNYIVKTIFEGGVYVDAGTTYGYSNSAYYLLGIIIEKLSGETYRDYLKKHFFKLADMKNTYFVGDGKDTCTGYSYNEMKYVSDKDSKELAAEGDYPYLFSAGSVVSNVEDVNKWLNIVTSNELFTAADRKTIEKSLMHYNYGWNTSDDLWHHSGRTYAYSSQIYADYKTDTKLVILTNIAFYDALNQIALGIYLPLVNEVKNGK